MENVRLDASAADRAYEISITAAPNNPVVLAARLQHLFLSDRFKNKQEEVEDLLARIKRFGSLQPQTWLMEATWASLIGDEARVVKAMHIGLSLDEAAFRELAERIGVTIK